jgi:hypothetical protein
MIKSLSNNNGNNNKNFIKSIEIYVLRICLDYGNNISTQKQRLRKEI